MESTNVLTHRSWKLVNIDKVIVMGGLVGLVSTICESGGLNTLSTNLDRLWALEMKGFKPEVALVVKLILWMMIVIKSFTWEVYIGCYVVMIYAFISGKKSVAYPWIAVGAIRSIFVKAVSCFTACLIFAHYDTIKYAFIDYAINKGFSLACSVCLWTVVYESYTNRTQIIGLETSDAVHQVRSLESILAEAVVDWFLEEAERCRTFDSKLAVDEDEILFEQGISQRAAQFLELTPEEILEKVRAKMDRRVSVPKVSIETQTVEIGKPIDDTSSKSDTSVNNQTISEFDMEIKNPLRRFPYFPLNENLDSLRTPSDEYINDDTVLGNKCVSVQTFVSFRDML